MTTIITVSSLSGRIDTLESSSVNGNQIADSSIGAEKLTDTTGSGNVVLDDGAEISNITFTTNQWITSSDAGQRILFTNGSSTVYNSPTDHRWRYDDGNTDTMVYNGNLGIGTITPTERLEVAGNARVSGGNLFVDGNITASGDVTAQSDARLKKEFRVLDNAIKRIESITGYTYSFLDDHSSKRHVGVIAQDVEAVLPEAVVRLDESNPESVLSVAYGNMVALLIEGIKELNTKHDRETKALSARILELEKMAVMESPM